MAYCLRTHLSPDATIVAAPKQRNTEAEKREISQGRIPEDWKAKPAKLRQKDRDGLCHIAKLIT